MRKHISRLLALVLILSSLTLPNISLFAAPTIPLTTTSSGLTITPGVTADCRPFLGATSAIDNANFNWPISGNANGTYYLRYTMKDGVIGVLKVVKTGSSADVFFNTYDATTGVEVVTTPYKVYNGYTTPKDYVTVTSTSAPDLGDPNNNIHQSNTPYFTVAKGNGFSFQYGGSTINFLWDKSGDPFYVTINKINPGNVYDFDLYYDSTNSTTSYTDANSIVQGETTKIFKGLDTNAITSTKYANNGRTITPSNIDPIDFVTDHSGLIPGDQVASIEFAFDIPKIWDPGTNKFVTMSNTVWDPGTSAYIPYTTPLEAHIVLTQKTQNTPSASMKIDFADLLATPLAVTNTKYPTTATVTNGRVVVRVDNVPESTIFNPATLNIVMDNATKATIDDDSVNTFLKYEIVEEDGQYYVQFDPYNAVAGTYQVYSDSGPNNRFAYTADPGAFLEKESGTTVSAVDSVSGKPMIKLPVTLGEPDKYFQVRFTPEGGKTIISQVIHYASTGSKILKPNNFTVVEPVVLAATSESDANGYFPTAEVSFKLKWDVMKSQDLLDALATSPSNEIKVVYDLNRAIDPNGTGEETYGQVELRIFKQGAIIMVEYNNYGTSTVVDTSTNPQAMKKDLSNVYYAELPIKDDAIRKTPSIDNFAYPEIYYMSVEPYFVNYDPASFTPDATLSNIGGVTTFEDLRTRTGSVYDSLTLNDLTTKPIPAPQNFALKSPTDEELAKKSFYVTWTSSSERLNDYFTTMFLESAAKTVDSIKYNIFISTNENEIKKLTNGEAPSSMDVYDFNITDIPNTTISFSSEAIDTTLTPIQINGKEGREAVRKGGVVEIKGVPYTFSQADIDKLTSGTAIDINYSYLFDGLDQNQKYFVCIQSEVFDSLNANTGSSYTNIKSISTNVNSSEPKESDITPASTKVVNVSDKYGNNTIEWDRNLEILGDGESISYEVLRVSKSKVADDFINKNTKDYEYLWNNDLSSIPEKIGFIVQDKDGSYKVVDGTTYTEKEADPNKYIVTLTDDIVRLTDSTFVSNELYFYYVRVVRSVADTTGTGADIKKYSPWSGVSITTSPVKGVINLIQERDASTKKYDPQTEAWFSFDAPIGDISKLGVDYFLEYQIRVDGGNWQTAVPMDSTLLLNNGTSIKTVTDPNTKKDTIYQHMLYKIAGLKAGTTYSIRVRMKDDKGDYSMYSNIVNFITEFNQDDYDKDKADKDYTEYYKDELEKLINTPQWTVKDDDKQLEVIYRPSAIDELIKKSSNGQIVLPSSNANQFVYYIPKDGYEKMKKAKKGLVINNKGMDILIPDGFIDLDTNEAAIAIRKLMKEKKIKDYFVKITVNWTYPTKTIEGDKPISSQAEVIVELVGSTTDINVWETNSIKELKTDINDAITNPDFAKQILLDKETDVANEATAKFVADQIKATGNTLEQTTSSEMAKMFKFTYPIEKFDKPISLLAKNVDTSSTVKGYENVNNSWVNKTIVNIGKTKGMYATNPGIYIFSGNKIIIKGIENIKNGGNVSAIVSKYGLDDYLGKGEIDMKDTATKDMVVNSISRMSGAPKGTDGYKWLKSKFNITVSSRGSNKSIKTDEAVDIIMKLYENKTKTKVNNVAIKNYNGLKNVTGVTDKYKKVLMVAIEAGIIDSNDFNAKSNISIEDLFKMLGNLDKKVKLK